MQFGVVRHAGNPIVVGHEGDPAEAAAVGQVERACHTTPEAIGADHDPAVDLASPAIVFDGGAHRAGDTFRPEESGRLMDGHAGLARGVQQQMVKQQARQRHAPRTC